MLRYKVDILAALKSKGITARSVRHPGPYSGLFGQSIFHKLKTQDTSISFDVLNRLCIILECQPGDLIEFVENREAEREYYVWEKLSGDRDF